MPTTLTIEHVGQHPRRGELSILGALSSINLGYQQFVRETDPKNPTKPVEPYKGLMPRTYEGKPYNGGSPWSPTFNMALMVMGLTETQERFYRTQNGRYVADFEDDAVNKVFDDGATANPIHVRQSLAVYAQIARITGQHSWAFPRWSWLPSIMNYLPQWQEVARLSRAFHLDGYKWHSWQSDRVKVVYRSLAHAVTVLGGRPEDCVLYHRWCTEGENRPLTAQDWEEAFSLGTEFGFTRRAIWHNGDEWSKAGDAGTKDFEAGIKALSEPAIRKVFDKWMGRS